MRPMMRALFVVLVGTGMWVGGGGIGAGPALRRLHRRRRHQPVLRQRHLAQEPRHHARLHLGDAVLPERLRQPAADGRVHEPPRRQPVPADLRRRPGDEVGRPAVGLRQRRHRRRGRRRHRRVARRPVAVAVAAGGSRRGLRCSSRPSAPGAPVHPDGEIQAARHRRRTWPPGRGAASSRRGTDRSRRRVSAPRRTPSRRPRPSPRCRASVCAADTNPASNADGAR